MTPSASSFVFFVFRFFHHHLQLQFHPHLHVHLLSSSSPLPPLHRLGVGLSPTRIACASSLSVRCWVKSHPDCLWHLYYDACGTFAGVDTSSRQTGSFGDRSQSTTGCISFKKHRSNWPMQGHSGAASSVCMRCFHVYDCLNPGLHIRSHGG